MKTYHHIYACIVGLSRCLTNRIAIVVAITIFAVVPLSRAENPFSTTGNRLFEECKNAISARRYDVAARTGEELSRLGKSEGNEIENTVGDAMMLHARIAVRDTADFTSLIESLIKKAPELKERWPNEYAVVTRTVSSYYQRILNDYSQALLYASETLDAVRRAGDRNAEAAALSVLASIYFQKQDMAGWSYAVDSYNLALEHGDNHTKYVAACNLANFLYNKMKYDEALKYLKEAEGYASKAKLNSEDCYLNSFLGDVSMRLGKPEEGERYYRRSLEDNPETPNYDKVYSRICYAIFLVENNRLQDALDIAFSAQQMAQKYKVTIFDKELYSLLSRIYEEKGDFKRSLDFHKKYMDSTLKVISEQKEREFAILDLRNRVSEEERKNASQALELAKRGKTIILLSSVGAIFLIVCVGGFFYHRKKVKGYEEVVKRYLDNVRSERLLREQLEHALQQKKESKSAGLDEERQTDIFMRLEKLLREDKIYRDSSLSLNKAAELLSTNRTYLSQVVNEKSGKSFSSYINECRLSEAVQLLSDPVNEESLKEIGVKVGFTSSSNFYTLFKQRVGVSPSVFRENVKKIEPDRQNQQNDILN